MLRIFACCRCDVRLDLIKLLLLNVAVKQQRSVVFIVVSDGIELVLLFVGRLNQLLQVHDQIIQLRHLYKSLDHIARIQVADRLFVLGDCILEILLVIEFVSVLLTDLSDDVGREFCVFSDLFGLSKKHFLHERVNFDVVVHLVQLAEDELIVGVLGEVVNCVVLDFDLQDARVRRCPIRSYSVVEVVYLKRTLRFFILVALTSTSWLKIYRNNEILKVPHILFVILQRMLLIFPLRQTVLPNEVFLLLALPLARIDHQRVGLVVEIGAFSPQKRATRLSGLIHLNDRLSSLLYIGVVENAPLQQQVHIVLQLIAHDLLENEEINYFAHLFALAYVESAEGFAHITLRPQVALLVEETVEHDLADTVFKFECNSSQSCIFRETHRRDNIVFVGFVVD
jgi:hypothetical protein